MRVRLLQPSLRLLELSARLLEPSLRLLELSVRLLQPSARLLELSARHKPRPYESWNNIFLSLELPKSNSTWPITEIYMKALLLSHSVCAYHRYFLLTRLLKMTPVNTRLLPCNSMDGITGFEQVCKWCTHREYDSEEMYSSC